MPRMSFREIALATSVAFAFAALAWTPASAVQRTVSIYQIQDTTLAGHVVVGSTDTITTTGVLVASDTRSAYGFVLQDPAGGPFSGIHVITGSVNAFVDSGYARGDLITVTGRVNEFNGLTQILSRSGSAFNGTPTSTKVGTAAIPAAIPIASYGSVSELAAYQFAERYEGCRVSMTNGKTERLLFPETWLVTDSSVPASTDTVRLDGFNLCWPVTVAAPAIGVIATSFQGIVGQETRGYGVYLRDIADIVVPAPPTLLNAWAISNSTIRLLFDRPLDPVTAEDETKYSRSITLGSIDLATLVGGAGSQIVDLTTTTDPQVPGEAERVTASAVKSALGVAMPVDGVQDFRAGVTPIQLVQTNALEDSSQFAFEQVTVRGIIHARDENLYYIQDGIGTNPSSAVAIFSPPQSMQVGDDVTVSGTIIEFGSTSNLTEYSGLSYQQVHANGVTKFDPVVVSPGVIGVRTGVEPYSGEAYEAMFVELQNVTVVADSLPNGMFLVQGAGGTADTALVDDTMFRQDYLYGFGANLPTVVPYIRGVVNDAFGQYTVNPRDSADISNQLVDVQPGAGALDFAIRAITPTPVSFARGASAVVSFNLPTAGRASLRVYDVAGRLVATPLSNAEFAAGPQAVSLDSRSLGGGRLGSGIFFVQLQLGNRLATAKLVVTD